MAAQIFVNLPVRDLQRSMSFFAGLGYTFDPKFTDGKAACMIVSENIYVMLILETFFQTFTNKPLCDATKSTEVLVCLSFENREKVDELVAKALSTGGSVAREPQDYGFMYVQSIEDPDGHIWELMFMEPEKA